MTEHSYLLSSSARVTEWDFYIRQTDTSSRLLTSRLLPTVKDAEQERVTTVIS
jgi:hypothetical protein